MRDGFRDIVSGWTLVDDFEDLTDRIELSAEWTKQNGPLLPDEAAMIELMIKAQIARGLSTGHLDFFRHIMGCMKVQPEVRADGSCLACPAGQGEACRLWEALL